jgi:hypothetical protein
MPRWLHFSDEVLAVRIYVAREFADTDTEIGVEMQRRRSIPSHRRSDSIRTTCELRNSELSYRRRSSFFLSTTTNLMDLTIHKLSTPALCCLSVVPFLQVQYVFKISVYNVLPANFYRSLPSLPSYSKPCPKRCLQNGSTSCSTLGW